MLQLLRWVSLFSPQVPWGIRLISRVRMIDFHGFLFVIVNLASKPGPDDRHRWNWGENKRIPLKLTMHE